jgi:hypothetical protein
MQTSRASEFKGSWILVPQLLIILVAFNLTFEDYVRRTVGMPNVGSPGDSPPFYYLREYCVQGVCAGVALLLALTLSGLTWRRYPLYSGMCLWMAWLWFMPRIVDAVIIYSRCSHLMDVQRAASGWNTLHEFLNDPFRRAAYWATVLPTLPLALFLSWRARKQSSDAAGMAPLSSPSQ